MFSTLVLSACLLLAFLASALADINENSLPMWKRQLLHYRWWKGWYKFNNQSHPCNLVVHSVQFDTLGGATVSFSADSTTIDMDVYSPNDVRILFREETRYNGSDHFYDEFEFVVELLPFGQIYNMQGNITKPKANFTSIHFWPDGTTGTTLMESSSLSIGLAIGISIFLFIVCVIVGIVILRWAIKKGYLRHVAMSYKSFRNPDVPVSFDNSSEGSRADDVQVHI